MVRHFRIAVVVMLGAVIATACNFGPMTPLPEEDGGMLIPAVTDSLPR